MSIYGFQQTDLPFSLNSRASQLAPDNLKTMLLITELHLKLGDVDMAVHSVKSCLHSDPENKHCSRLFRKTKKLVKLMEKIESMLEKRQCRDALNDAYLDPERRGKDSAQSLMSELGVEAGLRAKVAAKTCHCLVQTKNTEGARQWCDDAVALNPDDVTWIIVALLTLRRTLCAIGQSREF
jgi:hypothetical protein